MRAHSSQKPSICIYSAGADRQTRKLNRELERQQIREESVTDSFENDSLLDMSHIGHMRTRELAY